MNLRNWFARFASVKFNEQTRLDVMRASLKDETPKLRVLFEKPERDEYAKRCVHMWGDNDNLALAIQREREQARQPRNVVSIRVGTVRS